VTTRHDVVIVGAGSVGLPTALALARAGLRPLVLDDRASPGQGANKAAIGGVRATHSDAAKIRLCRRSLEVFATWQAEHGDDIEWVRGGYAFVAYREQEEVAFRALLEVQHRHGLRIEWLHADAMLRAIPDLAPDDLRGGTVAPDDGHLSTLLASHAMYRAALGAGATFRFGERVTALEVELGRVRAVRTDRGRYPTEFVVNAAGAGAARVGAYLGEVLAVRPDLHEAGITEPVAPFLPGMLVDVRPGPGSANVYLHQTRGGQVIFCLTPRPPSWGDDTRVTSTFLPMVARRVLMLLPRLAGARVRRTWRGVYPMTPDGSPLVGRSATVAGVVHAVGMCGQGFMLGPGVGELIARLAQGSTTAEDEETLSALSPQRAFTAQEVLR
jgi:sarcosine oxidase, subunit beta